LGRNQDSAECVALQRRRKDGCIMKKIVLVLAVLVMAAPASAKVVVWLTADGNEVTVHYDATTEVNLVRGFALDIAADDANIVTISNYHVGDSNSDSNGYGIFPGSFGRLDQTDGDFPVWTDPCYSPLAWKVDYPSDTLDGLGSNGITIEIGSLYYPATGAASPNCPPKAGVLCKFKVDGECTLTVNENAIRGGVVMERPDQSVTVDPCGCTVQFGCFPSDHKDYAAWLDASSPKCWCSEGMQCYGDADGKTISGKFATYAVSSDDLALLIAGWERADGLSGSGGQPYYCEDVNTTGPTGYWDGWVCADFNRSKVYGKFATYRVSSDDLAILIWNWENNNAGEKTGDPNACCPYKKDCLTRGH